MDRRKFNRDMGSYINSRRKIEKDFGKTKVHVTKQAPPTVDPDEIPEFEPGTVHVEYRRPSLWSRIFSRRGVIEEVSEDLTPEERQKLAEMEAQVEGIEDQMEEIEEMEEELRVERDSILDRILHFMGFGVSSYEEVEEYDDDEEEFEEESMVSEDMKQVLKIMHAWLEKLPLRQKKAFKDSEDFQIYKEILLKYGLIRVRAPKEEVKIEEAPEEPEASEETEAPVEEPKEEKKEEDRPIETEEGELKMEPLDKPKKKPKKKKAKKKK